MRATGVKEKQGEFEDADTGRGGVNENKARVCLLSEGNWCLMSCISAAMANAQAS